MTNYAPGARNGDESRWRPPGRRVVDSNAIERLNRRSKIRNARVVYRADLSLGRAVSTSLSPLDHARDVLVDRVRSYEMHVRDKPPLSREHRLVDRRGRAQGGFDRERLPALNVVEHEALTLFRDCPAHVARDCPIAAENLSTAVIDVETVDTERTDRKASRLAAAWRPGDHDHARARHRPSAGFERRVGLGEHVGWKGARDEFAVGVDDA
ncbi:MAG: hypothetical protein QM756_33095 [Polyangiaceae bacterium]